jgi:hypothetical protein
MTIILNGKELALKSEEDFSNRVSAIKKNLWNNSNFSYYSSRR